MVNKNFELQQKTTDLSTEDRYNVTGITFHDNISFKKSFAPPPTSPPLLVALKRTFIALFCHLSTVL